MAGKPVKVVILGDASNAQEAFRKVQEAAGGMEAKLGAVSKKMSSVGESMTKYVTVPLAAIATGAVAAAVKFDEASDTIRAGTGATGEALASLNRSFKEVFRTVPASAQDVATAIADLNTRTGATGERLEGLAKQVLTVSRLTGEDLGGVIAATTRVFGDWSISTDKQAEALDYLWKVSQNTGIGVTQLSEKVVQFGAPLRQLGFDFETAAAMMGKWEKEGVNTETVLAGLKVGLAGFAASGKDAKTALLETIDAIKNAGSASEATAIAIEVFGRRAGPDMAAAIREGRFDLADLLTTLSDSKETIQKAADDTLSFSDKLVILKNKAMEAVVPLGEKLLGALDKLWPTIEKVVEWVGEAVDWFTKLPESAQNAIIIFGAIVAAAGPLLSALSPVVSALSGLGGALSSLASAAGATGAAGAIGALSSALVGLAAVAVAIGLAKLIYDILDGKRASDSFHESVQKNIQSLDGVTQKQKDFALATLTTADTQIKLRDLAAGVIRPLEDQKRIAAELVEAWALSGARTKEELEAVATKVYESYDRMGAKTAETLYGDGGIVVTNQRGWNEASLAIGLELDKAKSMAEEKWDLIKLRTGAKVDEIKTTTEQRFEEIKTAMAVKLDEAKTAAEEKFDLIKKLGEGTPGAIGQSLAGLPAAIESAFKEGYDLAAYWASRIRGLNVSPSNPASARPFFGAATGAVVPATPGGVPLVVAEGGESEWVVPESKLKAMLKYAASAPSGGGRVFNIGPIYITGARAEGEAAGDAILTRLAALGVTG